jgi:hypothetical protein
MSTVPPTSYCVAPTSVQFLLDFPDFDTSAQTDPDAVEFSPEAINYWLNFAVQTLNQPRWGNWYYTACELFTAHNLSLEAWTVQGGDQTVPGIAKGMIAASASGDVSVTYNNAAVLEMDAGHWNFTTYGIRLKRMINMIGMGPMQVMAPGCAPPFNGPAWAGPPFFNFPNPQE